MTAIPEQAPERPARQRRYTSATVQLARTMYGDGDAWTPTQIMRYLNERGIPVTLNTVWLWVVPGAADEQRRHNANAARRRRVNRQRATGRTPATGTPLGRMLALREAGLTFAAIAAIMRLDWGLEIDADRARYCVRNEVAPDAVPRPGRPRKHPVLDAAATA